MTFPVDPARLLTFLGVMGTLVVTPGPAVLFSIANGARAGASGVAGAVVGISAASLLWFAGAALGLGALMARAPGVFHPLSWIGVAYVAWLAGKAVWAGLSREGPAPPEVAAGSARSGAPGGFAVQIANPKMLVFFSGVLPTFLDAGRPLGGQLAVFAAAALGLDAVSLTAYGLGGAALARRLERPAWARGFALASGVLLAGAAALITSRLIQA